MLNLTQHTATIGQGIVWEPARKEEVKALLTFHELPDPEDVEHRALCLADLAAKELMNEAARGEAVSVAVMIGGAPYLMAPLERALRSTGLVPYYAFTERVVTESEDGTKTSHFQHKGWVEATT